MDTSCEIAQSSSLDKEMTVDEPGVPVSWVFGVKSQREALDLGLGSFPLMRVRILLSSLPDAPQGGPVSRCGHPAEDPEVSIRVSSARSSRVHSAEQQTGHIKCTPTFYPGFTDHPLEVGGHKLLLLIFTRLFLLL